MDAPKLREGPQKKRPRRQESEMEDNSDDHPEATSLTPEEESMLDYNSNVFDPVAVEEELLHLYQRYRRGEFTYRHFNTVQLLRLSLTAVDMVEQNRIGDPESVPTSNEAILNNLLIEGGGMAARREALLGRWKFVYRQVFVRWQFIIASPLMVVSHVLAFREETWKRRIDQLVFGERFGVLVNMVPRIRDAAAHVLRGTNIPAILSVPPRLLKHTFSGQPGQFRLDTFSRSDGFSVVLNGLLIHTWLGFGSRDSFVDNGLYYVEKAGTPEQKKTVKVVESYLRLTEAWGKYLKTEWQESKNI